MNKSKKIVIVGATSAIAEQCTRIWLAKRPTDLTLVGRDTQRLERVATDLKTRSPQSEIRIVQSDFSDPKAIDITTRDTFKSGPVDIVLIAHGVLPDQDQCQDDLQSCRDALEINGISPVLYAEAFAKEMKKLNHGTIALISSVAGDRGRKSNYIYGAAKGLITRYVQGLQHRFAGSEVKVVLIKPGPTETPMTAHLENKGARLAPVADVAQQIVQGIDSGKSVIYAPKKWSLIMMIIRHLPAFILNKMNI
jgi:decaprenylphospho-beta-D-erythro-pentofuranosid-2-ulose 2-reductase